VSIVAIGVDIGERHDPTAVVVVEYERLALPVEELPRGLFDPAPDVEPEPEYETQYLVRALGRLPLGTSYPDVARHVNRVCMNIRKKQPNGSQHLLIDQTGVGRPVMQMIARLLDPAIHLTAVTFTGTDKCDSAPLHRPEISMGKAFMVSRLQAALQDQRLKMPRSRLSEDLVTELKTYEVKVMESGREKYGAFAEGALDDLVSALGMACLGDVHQVVTYRESLYQ
jgi:hypothetical protein